jgi:hypothetical protein
MGASNTYGCEPFAMRGRPDPQPSPKGGRRKKQELLALAVNQFQICLCLKTWHRKRKQLLF